MKKIIAGLLVLSLVFALMGCKTCQEADNTNGPKIGSDTDDSYSSSYNSSSSADNFGQDGASAGETDGIDSQQQPAEDVTATVVPGETQKTVVNPKANTDYVGTPSQPGANPFANKNEQTKYTQPGTDEAFDPASK